MKKKKEQLNAIQTLSNKTSLPLDLLCGYPYLQLFSNRELLIEGVYGLCEYTSEKICVNVGKKKLSISGRSLNLGRLNNKNMSVTGYITNIEFE